MQQYHGMSADDTLRHLESGREGLDNEQAQQRIAQHGRNELTAAKKKGLIVRFLAQFKNVMVIILLCAAAITAVVAVAEHNYQEFIDVGIILAIVLINAVIGVVQEAKAEQALAALKSMSKPYAKVRRNGKIEHIESALITVGDIVILEAGDVVPADVRLIDSRSLKIEESALTGESVPSEKQADAAVAADAGIGDRVNMAYSSSTVVYGRGEGVVCAVGMNTEMGKIAVMLSDEGENKTPIQRKLDKTGKFISIGVVCIAVVIFLVSILSNLHLGLTIDTFINSFMTAVAIAVAAIPEGLTAVITIIMAIGVQRMSKRNAIIKKLPAVETLGSTEIICSDKTGTLTLNRMTVTDIYTLCKQGEEKTLACMALCNDSIISDENNARKYMGDPTETALVQYFDVKGDSAALRKECKRVDEVPFDSERKLMSTVNEVAAKRTVFTKGAPDELIKRCTHILKESGREKLSQSDVEDILARNKAYAGEALRVLAYAYKEDDGKGDYESGLTFAGLTGMIDPPREEVKEAVKLCKRAGIIPVMITGDHRDTAFAIAKQLGICNDEKAAITGAQLQNMTDDELFESVEKYRVYARVSPEHKVRIVKAWKKRGKVVAMTGDGVNDAPSIKAADIGIGMGITGTDVTKGAADMVLADDNFATIVDAVSEGRKIFDNMQKTIQFLLAANIAEVLALFVATLVFTFTSEAAVFLYPIQILWVNLVTDSLPALALGMEKGNQSIMDNPPRKSSDNLFAGHLGVNILYQGLLQAAIVLTVFLCATYGGWGHEIGSTMAFVTLSLVQLFHCFNCKSLNKTIFHRDIFQNRFMLLAFFIGLVLTVGVVLLPGLSDVFKMAHLNIWQWLISIAAALAVIPLVEIGKVIIRAVLKRKHSHSNA